MKKCVIVVISIAIGFTACKKSNSVLPPQPTQMKGTLIDSDFPWEATKQ